MNPRFERIIYTVDNMRWHWGTRDNDRGRAASGSADSRAEAEEKTLAFAREAQFFDALTLAKADAQWEPFNA